MIELLKIAVLYVLLNVMLLFVVLMLLNPIKNLLRIAKDNGEINEPSIIKKLEQACAVNLPLTISIVIVLMFVSYVNVVIGCYPYGPDTAVYTYLTWYLSMYKHWSSELVNYVNPYYALYHTSVVNIYITKSISGLERFSYSVYLIALNLALILSVVLIVHRISRTMCSYMVAPLCAMLYLATPPLMGMDVLQQYVGIVLSLVALMAIRTTKVSDVISFTIAMIVAVISHLSGVFLILTMLMIEIFVDKSLRMRYEKNEMRTKFIAVTLLVAIVYCVYSYASQSVITTLKNIVMEFVNFIVYGLEASRTFVIRAYSEIPLSRLWLYAWSFLPSLSIAFIIYVIAMHNKLKHLEQYRKRTLLITASGFMISIATVILGAGLRFLGVDVLRYCLVPAYYIAFVCGVVSISLLMRLALLLRKIKGVLALTILSLIIIACLWVGIRDPLRMPWNGGLRLAPVTFEDRIEMIALAKHLRGSILVFAWHDVYIPPEYVENSQIRVASKSYYPMHRALVNVSKGLNIAWYKDYSTDLVVYILPKVIVSTKAYRKYDVIFYGGEHVVLVSLHR